jgi:hypothetical protein
MGSRNLFRFISQFGLINEKQMALKNHQAWKRNKFRDPESSQDARIPPFCTAKTRSLEIKRCPRN